MTDSKQVFQRTRPELFKRPDYTVSVYNAPSADTLMDTIESALITIMFAALMVAPLFI